MIYGDDGDLLFLNNLCVLWGCLSEGIIELTVVVVDVFALPFQNSGTHTLARAHKVIHLC